MTIVFLPYIIVCFTNTKHCGRNLLQDVYCMSNTRGATSGTEKCLPIRSFCLYQRLYDHSVTESLVSVILWVFLLSMMISAVRGLALLGIPLVIILPFFTEQSSALITSFFFWYFL